jgi:hypothetical protein
MRAVRARLTALLGRLADFLPFARALAVGLFLIASVDGAFAAAEAAGCVEDAAEVCAAIGATAISRESRLAMHREAKLGTEVGEIETLIV